MLLQVNQTKCLEPSIIAEACLNMLSYLFNDAPSYLTIPKPSKFEKCLLLGYGAIGQALAYALTHTGDLGMFLKECVYVFRFLEIASFVELCKLYQMVYETSLVNLN
jgi:hypothetical protein